MQASEIQRQGGWYSPWSRQELKFLLPRAMELICLPGSFVELKLCGDREIARLNEDFLGLPGPTDVLSFPAQEESSQLLGQVCISLPAVHREAVLYAQDPGTHMLRLLLHGILHLAGYRHGQEMQELTEEAVHWLCA